MPTDVLTCPELCEVATDYLEESLPAPKRKRFEAPARLRELRGWPESNARNVESLGKFPRRVAHAGGKAQVGTFD